MKQFTFVLFLLTLNQLSYCQTSNESLLYYGPCGVNGSACNSVNNNCTTSRTGRQHCSCIDSNNKTGYLCFYNDAQYNQFGNLIDSALNNTLTGPQLLIQAKSWAITFLQVQTIINKIASNLKTVTDINTINSYLDVCVVLGYRLDSDNQSSELEISLAQSSIHSLISALAFQGLTILNSPGTSSDHFTYSGAIFSFIIANWQSNAVMQGKLNGAVITYPTCKFGVPSVLVKYELRLVLGKQMISAYNNLAVTNAVYCQFLDINGNEVDRPTSDFIFAVSLPILPLHQTTGLASNQILKCAYINQTTLAQNTQDGGDTECQIIPILSSKFTNETNITCKCNHPRLHYVYNYTIQSTFSLLLLANAIIFMMYL